MKHVFILNPVSGNGKLFQLLHKKINEICIKRKINFEIYVTRCVNDAEQYATKIAKSKEQFRIYVCGGDGTLNEVANGIKDNKNIELAIIPCGTGNDFVRNFKNKEFFLQIERQLDGIPIDIDLIQYGNRVCINMCNVGFDSAVAKTVNSLRRNPILSGKLAYINGVILNFIKMPKSNHKLVFDDGEISEGQFLLTAIGNGRYYGGGFNAASLASPQDGFMDVITVTGNLGRLQFLSLIGAYKKGTLIGNQKVKHLLTFKRCKSVTLIPRNESSLCVDGEVDVCREFEFIIKEKALSFILPRGVFLMDN